MAEAVVRYETIGSVGIGSLAGDDVETSPKLREAVRVEACKVGADTVLLGANTASSDRIGRAAAVWLPGAGDAASSRTCALVAAPTAEAMRTGPARKRRALLRRWGRVGAVEVAVRLPGGGRLRPRAASIGV